MLGITLSVLPGWRQCPGTPASPGRVDAPGWPNRPAGPAGEGRSQRTVALNNTRRCGVAASPWPDMPSVIVLAFGLRVEPSDGEGL